MIPVSLIVDFSTYPRLGLVQGNSFGYERDFSVLMSNGRVCTDHGIPPFSFQDRPQPHFHGIIEAHGIIYKLGGKLSDQTEIGKLILASTQKPINSLHTLYLGDFHKLDLNESPPRWSQLPEWDPPGHISIGGLVAYDNLAGGTLIFAIRENMQNGS